MMRSYVDEKYFVFFFEALIKSKRYTEEAAQRNEIIDFFKGKTDLFLNTNFESILLKMDKKTQEITKTIFLNKLTTGCNGHTIYTNLDSKFRELKRSEVYSIFKVPFASFWLGENYKHSIEKYSEVNPFYFLSPKDDVDKWHKFSNNKSLYIGSSKEKSSDDVLKGWDDIKKLVHPFVDMIISDRYCLNEKIGIEENIIPLILNLSLNKKSEKNIVFFTKKGQLYKNSLKETYKIVKNGLKENGINCKITIYESKEVPHDRFIITNNYFIKSGDSFDYFFLNGSLKTRGTTITFTPIFDTNKSELLSIINRLKNIISKTTDDAYYGTKSKTILDLVITE